MKKNELTRREFVGIPILIALGLIADLICSSFEGLRLNRILGQAKYAPSHAFHFGCFVC